MIIGWTPLLVIDMCMQCSYRLGHGVGINHDLIVSEVSTLLDDSEAYDKMSKAVNPYGDGKACGRIVDALR